MDIYRSSLPIRGFKHAAAGRNTAEAVVVAVEFDDGAVGWGETLPREYVTGESLESVLDDLRNVIWPRWAGKDMPLGVATEIAPAIDKDRCINAAICAFDLACVRRLFANVLETPTELLQEISGRAQVRREIDVPVSGVLGASRPRKAGRRVHAMRWFGIDHFKLKFINDEAHDAAALQSVRRTLGRSLTENKTTLRVDVNGAWDMANTPERATALKAMGVIAVEQPVFCDAREFVALSRECPLPLIADESLLTQRDAEVLLAEPHRIWWNIRLSKNGGLLGALKLARLAAATGVTFVLGCMVGESSLLSAAQRRMLQMGPGPRYVEGNYGRWLLRGDLTDRTLNFRYGGRLTSLSAEGLGIRISPAKLEKFAQHLATLHA